MFAIFKRDLRSYFTTPVGYVFIGIFLAVSGGIFSLFTLQKSTSDTSSYFSVMLFALVVLIPLLTMKSFSEEKKLRTEQLLMTSPVSLGGMVFGKFLAAYSIFAGTFIVSGIQFFILSSYGEVSGGKIVGSMIALLLVGGAFTAIGIFISAMTENQVISAVATMAIMIVLLVIGMLNSYIPFAAVRKVLSWISIYSRYSNFTYGYFDFSALLYYVSISFVFLFLTVRVYERRRWA